MNMNALNDVDHTNENQSTENTINFNAIDEFNLSPAKRFGPVFKNHRENQGLSISDVSSRIKLSPRQLEAIESGEWAKLPSGAFVRGALRSYAKQLNFDIEPILQEYNRFENKDTSDITLLTTKNYVNNTVAKENQEQSFHSLNIQKSHKVKKMISILTILGGLATVAFVIYQTKGIWEPIINDVQNTDKLNNGGENNTNTTTNNKNAPTNLNNVVATMQESTDIVAIPSVSQALNNQVSLPEIQQKNTEAAIDTSTLTSSTAVNAVNVTPTVNNNVVSNTIIGTPILQQPTSIPTSSVTLKMEIGTDSWISVKTGQKATNLIRETKTAGSIIDTKGELPLKFSIRNPSTIKIFCNGKPYMIDEQKAKKLNADFTITSC